LTKIYIVLGRSGEYEEQSEWIVKGFISEKKAQKFVKDVQKIANELHKSLDNKLYYHTLYGKNPLDPKMECDFKEPEYYYCEVELEK